MVKNNDVQEEFKINTDLWNFYKSAHPIKNTDHYWNQIMKEVHKLSQKYNNNKFCNEMLIAYVNEIERKARQIK